MVRDKCAKNGKRLSGAVLIMVVTVMFVLIIMLLATLTVVSTAQNRYYTKYEENQAYYTARSALDVFTAQMLGDDQYIALSSSNTVRKYNYTDPDTGTAKQVDMSQGLGLELEFYKIKAQNTDDGWWCNPTTSDGVFASGSPEETNFTIATTGAPDSITYKVTFPKVSSGSTEYGRFVDTYKDTTSEHTAGEQVATIKVEVVKRIFNTEPLYSEDEMINAGAAGYPTVADVKKAIADGDRSKDQFLLKITSTVEFMGVEGQAVLYHQSVEPDQLPTGNAMTSFGEITLNNLDVLGGAATTKDFSPSNDPDIYGGMWELGNYSNGGSGTSINLTRGETAFVGGDFEWPNGTGLTNYDTDTAHNYSTTITADEVPFLYIGGELKNGQNFSSGKDKNSVSSSDNRLDVVVHGMSGLYNGFTANGNIYSVPHKKDASDLTIINNVLKSGDVDLTGLPSFTITNGGLYVKGNLRMCASVNVANGIYVDGDIILASNMYNPLPAGGYELTSAAPSNMYCTGRLLLDNGISDSGITPTGFTIEPAEDPINHPEKNVWDLLDIDDAEIEQEDACEVILPVINGSLTYKESKGALKREIGSKISVYSGYYYKYKDPLDGKIKLKDCEPSTPGNQYKPITAEDWAGTSPSDRKDANYTTMDFAPGGMSTIWTKNNRGGMVIGGNIISAPWGDYWDGVSGTETGYYINTASTADYLLIARGTDINNGFGDNSTTGSNYLRIEGGGTVNLYLQPGGDYGGKIVVADDTTLNVYAPASSSNEYTWAVHTYNDQIHDLVKNGQTLYFGNIVPVVNKLKPPKINFYIGGTEAAHTVWNVTNSGKNLTCGYVYAPYADIKGEKGSSVNWCYNNVDYGTSEMAFIGSIIAGNINFSDCGGVAYIDPNEQDIDYGAPKLKWSPQQYGRK